MPRPYARDLRERVVAAVQGGMSYDDAAATFRVGRATVGRWLQRYRVRGTVEPDPMGGAHNVKLDEAGLERLAQLVDEQPDRTFAELIDGLEEQLGCRVGVATIARGLTKLQLTRKKKTVTATEQSSERVQELRRRFLERMPSMRAERLIFIDETGTTLAMTRRYGRAPRGQPVHDQAPRNRGRVVTLIGAISIAGVEALMTIDCGTTAEVFLAFIEQVLAPALQPGDVLVMDNLGAHRERRVREAIARLGVKMVFTPPYSPEFNPIEMCWSKMKQHLRSAKARTREALDEAIANAAALVTPMDCGGWFAESGYQIST